MSTIVKAGIVSLAAVLLLPGGGKKKAAQLPPMVLVVEQPSAQAQTLRVLEGGGVETLGMEEYLTRVVLSEMPASFAPEARKAQAVAARTFAVRQMQRGKHPDADVCTDSACCQACLSVQALQQRYADTFDDVWEAARQVVEDTGDEVLLYDGALIDAVYFSCSGGTTEDAAAVWGSAVAYLQSVPSPGEQHAARYASTVSVPADTFAQTLQSMEPGITLGADPAAWVTQITRTAGGGVDTAIIGGRSFAGTALRRAFGLNSTKFTLQWENGAFQFDVLGFGHRVGMSQYGADAIARLGFDYQTILRYYYRGAEIKKAALLTQDSSLV